LVFIIYKVNNQFEKKEVIILVSILAITVVFFIIFNKKQDEFLPNLFKEHYENKKGFVIEKLSYERLDNKRVSSNKNFTYKFTYLIKKTNGTFLCTANNVNIEKIEDDYVFVNFNNFEENCLKQ
jgi:hypothetical protein